MPWRFLLVIRSRENLSSGENRAVHNTDYQRASNTISSTSRVDTWVCRLGGLVLWVEFLLHNKHRHKQDAHTQLDEKPCETGEHSQHSFTLRVYTRVPCSSR